MLLRQNFNTDVSYSYYENIIMLVIFGIGRYNDNKYRGYYQYDLYDKYFVIIYLFCNIWDISRIITFYFGFEYL